MATITVSTTPQLLPSGAYDLRSLVSNSATIWIDGVSTVSASNGYPIYPNEGFSPTTLDEFPEIWVVTASGTADLRYFLYRL